MTRRLPPGNCNVKVAQKCKEMRCWLKQKTFNLANCVYNGLEFKQFAVACFDCQKILTYLIMMINAADQAWKISSVTSSRRSLFETFQSKMKSSRNVFEIREISLVLIAYVWDLTLWVFKFEWRQHWEHEAGVTVLFMISAQIWSWCTGLSWGRKVWWSWSGVVAPEQCSVHS